jgi:gas vesicle structural protein
MAKRNRAPRVDEPTDADLILETTQEATLLDMLDKLLNKGVVLSGDVVLGVAGVDLVYLRLSSLLCAIDRIMPGATTGRKRRHNRGPRRLRLPGE